MSRPNEVPHAKAPQRRNGKLRVAAILKAGAAVISEKGHEMATMAEIAARSNTKIGSLYRFFPNKEVLANALIAHYHEGVHNAALRRLLRTSDRESPASGYTPEQVDEVLLTHLHADHVGGIAPGGISAFPNAVIRSSKLDADHWLNDMNEKAAPDFLRPMFEGDKASLKPYIAAGRYISFEGEQEMVPGIRAIPLPGHTPGHTSYAVESRRQKLLVWGDVVHVAAVQFPDPSVTVKYDSDEDQAEADRERIFSDAAKGGYWIGAAHISFPGLDM
jgi:glyoxylase-like metal-dependent hydrolase (beta-lactamase superfamily II)